MGETDDRSPQPGTAPAGEVRRVESAPRASLGCASASSAGGGLSARALSAGSQASQVAGTGCDRHRRRDGLRSGDDDDAAVPSDRDHADRSGAEQRAPVRAGSGPDRSRWVDAPRVHRDSVPQVQQRCPGRTCRREARPGRSRGLRDGGPRRAGQPADESHAPFGARPVRGTEGCGAATGVGEPRGGESSKSRGRGAAGRRPTAGLRGAAGR